MTAVTMMTAMTVMTSKTPWGLLKGMMTAVTMMTSLRLKHCAAAIQKLDAATESTSKICNRAYKQYVQGHTHNAKSGQGAHCRRRCLLGHSVVLGAPVEMFLGDLVTPSGSEEDLYPPPGDVPMHGILL